MKKTQIGGLIAFIAVILFFAAPWRAAFSSPKPQVATTHSITLSWTASTTSGVSYDVYRATSASGPFTKIASGLSVLTFVDTTAVPGTTYFYEVDATLVVSGQLEDSGPSNQESGAEPNNPNPPTGLAAASK